MASTLEMIIDLVSFLPIRVTAKKNNLQKNNAKKNQRVPFTLTENDVARLSAITKPRNGFINASTKFLS